jgi:3-oxoacyl-(acyl-carrier-protein) synthase
MLEELELARARGARIYAEVLGAHVNSGGHSNGGSMTAPNPDGVRRCIRAAVAQAGIAPREIDAINGHLTATFADPHEVRSWQAALELEPEEMPWINSTKSLVGHGLGAAGGLELVASVLQLHKGFVHGSLNCEDLHPELTAFAERIPHQTIEADIEVLAKASFGFGDVNGCLILRRWQE